MVDELEDRVIANAKHCNIQSSYIIQAEVGRGSFGIVRKVRKKHTRREYACKTLKKNDKTPIHMLQREIDSMRDLHHPHVLELQDVYEESRFIHIVSELCTGGELYERIGSGEWNATEQESGKLMQNILSAIAYLHQNGVVHRDLKASNFLFISPKTKTNVKIIDFGLARNIAAEDERLTTKVGTPYYVAPEVLTQDSYDSKCDVWSIGVIAFLVLSQGELPFCGKDEKETLELLKDPELQFCYEPTEVWDNWSGSAKHFCQALLQKDPEARPTAKEALGLIWIRAMTEKKSNHSFDHRNRRKWLHSSRNAMESLFHRFDRNKIRSSRALRGETFDACASERYIEDARKGNIQSSYIIQMEIGRGCFGIVRKIRKKHTRREYACKTLRKNDKTPIHMLQREIEAMQGLQHRHLLQLVEVFEEPHFVHIVSELCTGDELYQRVGSGHWNPTETECAQLLQNILSAISYLHDHGVVHRDLKASNFLFVTKDTNTNIKIIDFGLARKLPPLEGPTTEDNNSGVMENMLTTKVGTPYYVAPEVLLQDAYNAKCDVWSAGVIAYLVLSKGSLPYCGADERETCTMLKDDQRKCCFAQEAWSQWQPSAKAFCLALMERDPVARPTARQALDLAWIQTTAGPTLSPKQSSRNVLHTRSKHDMLENFLARKSISLNKP